MKNKLFESIFSCSFSICTISLSCFAFISQHLTVGGVANAVPSSTLRVSVCGSAFFFFFFGFLYLCMLNRL